MPRNAKGLAEIPRAAEVHVGVRADLPGADRDSVLFSIPSVT